jgi:hypothetical protein
MESITYETLKRVQGDKKGITTQSLKGREIVMFLPLQGGG